MFIKFHSISGSKRAFVTIEFNSGMQIPFVVQEGVWVLGGKITVFALQCYIRMIVIYMLVARFRNVI